MHWLQSLDTALFHFVNSTLANPFFDWLMPMLSGKGVPWLAAVVFAVPVALVFGSVRLRLCVLLMVLVVALGDPLVVGTIKDAVCRPRPFVTLPDARHFGETGKGYVPPLPDGSLPPEANVHSFPFGPCRQLVCDGHGGLSVLPAQRVVHVSARGGGGLFARL